MLQITYGDQEEAKEAMDIAVNMTAGESVTIGGKEFFDKYLACCAAKAIQDYVDGKINAYFSVTCLKQKR